MLGRAGGLATARGSRALSAGAGKILHGAVVLELASVLAGPSVGQFLGELGARVIKIESPRTRGDVTRTWRLASEAGQGDVTAYFSSCNLGKESVAVDMSRPEGRELVHALAARADCVLASFKPGDAEKLGMDAATLRSLNERLIYAQITGYGLDDHRSGYDAVVQAESGFQFMNGPPDGEPCKMPVALIDVITAHQLKEAVLVEFLRRERTGKGAAVNVSLMGSAVSALVNQAMGYLKEGAIPQRMGSDHPAIVPYGTIFSTRLEEEQITLGVGADSQFRALCQVLGRPDLGAPGSKFARNPDRCTHRDELKKTLADLLATWDRAELLDALLAAKVPSGAINNLEGTFKTRQAQELVVRGQSGDVLGLRQIAFKGTPEGLDAGDGEEAPRPAPKYAEHTSAVLGDILGFAEEKIAALRKDGVVE